MIVQLAKSLYGCVKSAFLWYKHLRSTLESLGYPYDECVFTKIENDQEFFDLMILSETKHLIDELIEHLQFIYKEVKYRDGDKHSYLGMQLSFDSDHLKISMEGYIDNILLENNVINQPVLNCLNGMTTIRKEFIVLSLSSSTCPLEQGLTLLCL
jgi:hypothetical protein